MINNQTRVIFIVDYSIRFYFYSNEYNNILYKIVWKNTSGAGIESRLGRGCDYVFMYVTKYNIAEYNMIQSDDKIVWSNNT